MSSDMVGVNPGAARQLAAAAAGWGGDVDAIVGLINEAVALSDVSCGAGSMLYQIASDGRAIAGSIRSAVDQIEGFTIDLDPSFAGVVAPDLRWEMGFEPGLGGGTVGPQQGPLTLQQAIDQASQRIGTATSTGPSGRAGGASPSDDGSRGLQAAIDEASSQWAMPQGFSGVPGGPPLDQDAEQDRWALGFEPGLDASTSVARPGGEPIDLQSAIDAASRQWAMPIGPLREVDRRVAELNEIDALWQLANQTERLGEEIWDFIGTQGETNAAANTEADRLRQKAWDRVVAMGEDPQVVLGALAYGSASNRDIVRALEIDRAQRLHDTAASLAGTPLAFEGDQMLAEVNDILGELYLTTESQEVLDRFGPQLDPYEIAAVAGYVTQTGDVSRPILDAEDPIRVLEVIAQGYTQEAALNHVAGSPRSGFGAMTFAELEAELAHLEASGQDNTYEFDATLRELNNRTGAMAGDVYVRADLDVVRIADRSGVAYADALAVVISQRLDQVGGPPGAQAAQIAAIEEDLAALVELRNEEALAATIVSIENSPGDYLTQQAAIAQARAALPDPPEEAARLRAIMGTGTNIFLAETLSAAMGADVAPWEAARITREINGLVEDDVPLELAAGVALAAFNNDIDLDDVVTIALDENVDLDVAFNLTIGAHRRDMTIDEYQAYQGFTNEAIFTEIDNAQGGETDGKVPIEDIDYVLDNPLEFDPEVVAAARAFRDSPNLMARLDTARDYTDNVVDHEGFGRDRLDDALWSLDDIDAFELKQNINFALADHVDLIDTAGEGGTADGHKSKQDYQSVLDNAEELGLSATEIAALSTVINGKMYDQNWLERNRDSLAIAAAVVAGTAIFVATGGVGAGLSVGLITSVAAATGGAALAAGVTTGGINAFTQEGLADGVVTNTIQGGIVGGLAAPGLATGGAGWSGATLGGRSLIATGLFGEAAGLVGAGALDWAIDPFYDGDSIDMANIHTDFDKASLLIGAGSIAAVVGATGGRKVVGSAARRWTPEVQAEIVASPQWKTFVRELDDPFLERLAKFDGDPYPTGKRGGEGQIFLSDSDPYLALKRWHGSRLNDGDQGFMTSVRETIAARNAVLADPDLARVVEVVQVHEAGPDWILRDFDPLSKPLSKALDEGLPGVDQLRAELLDSIHGTHDESLRTIAKRVRNRSENVHWSPQTGKILIIDIM